MNELIKVEQTEISNEIVKTVNARELHEFLGSKQNFADWIKNRIKKYEFAKDEDFTDHKFMIGKTTQIDYHISLDMAKELAMVENNTKGKQARRYFIECEKIVKQPKKEMSNTELMARGLIAASEEIKFLEHKVEQAQPAIEYYEAVARSTTSLKIGQFAKLLKTGQNRLFQWLRESGYLMSGGDRRNIPYQQYIDMGIFEVKQTNVENGTFKQLISTTYITPKGQQYIFKYWDKQKSA